MQGANFDFMESLNSKEEHQTNLQPLITLSIYEHNLKKL
jgi:hypothetical protein